MKPVISIIDDDSSVREGMVDLLRSMGFIAEAFEHAGAFLSSSRVHSTSCLIADVQMPGMTGLELYDHLVKSGNDIPTILITAFPNARDRDRAARAATHGYLAKPFNEIELAACIRKALNADGRRP
jgi:FixJ family two-component response regulator